MSEPLLTLTLATAVATGLVGGVFFAFSTFVMKALGRIPAPQGIASMQSINIAAISPLFMLALFGAAAACVAVGVGGLQNWGEPWAGYLVVGAGLYLVGVILPTMAANVPRNEALARLEPTGRQATSYWPRYLSSWTAWNHVRTTAALTGSAALVWSIHLA